MKTYIKKALPGSFGASFAVTLLEIIRHPRLWSVGSALLNFAFTLLVTTLFVTICFWLFDKFR